MADDIPWWKLVRGTAYDIRVDGKPSGFATFVRARQINRDQAQVEFDKFTLWVYRDGTPDIRFSRHHTIGEKLAPLATAKQLPHEITAQIVKAATGKKLKGYPKGAFAETRTGQTAAEAVRQGTEEREARREAEILAAMKTGGRKTRRRRRRSTRRRR